MNNDHKLDTLWPKGEVSEQLLVSLLDSVPDAMIIADGDGNIKLANSHAESMFGYAREQLWRKRIEHLIPRQHRANNKIPCVHCMEQPELCETSIGRGFSARRRDGSEFPVEVRFSPVRTNSGLYVASVIRDISTRGEIEQKLMLARQDAERATKANSAFLSAVSHDLRQPVQALSLLTGALRRTVKEPLALEMVDSLAQSINTMTNLLNSLLHISRLDARAVVPEFNDMSLSRLIGHISSEFSTQASQKGLDFTARSCDAIVRSDPDLLSEIIRNFVSNSIRYTDTGRVTLSCRVDKGECSVEVRDTGAGIEEDQLREIFVAFHQCNTLRGNKEGFGLGLAIVQRLADLLGHTVSVESVPGQGSCFSIALPIVGMRTIENDTGDSGKHCIASRKGSVFVMLLEDDARVADSLVMLFQSDGFDVGLAASAAEAIAVVKHANRTPCLIVSDYHLVGSATGVDAIKALRNEVGATVPAFLITGDTADVVEGRFPLENCCVMSKPVDPDRLLELANGVLHAGEVPA